MFEFLIALLIFSTGMMGLLSAQLAGKKAGYEASQRSVATVLARDILERMRANPRQIDAYCSAGVGARRLPRPEADCYSVTCSAEELAAFDLWEWESLLLGDSESDAGNSSGGLVSPRACITHDGGTVAVAISWLGLTGIPQADADQCGADLPGLGVAPGETGAGRFRRQQLTVSTYIGMR
jgi:type IV pilus assembly protein PilV